MDPKKIYLKQEFCNITIFPNRETGHFVATKLHANSSYEVCGDSQEDSSAQTTTESSQGTPFGSYTSYQFMQGPPLRRPPPAAYSSKRRKDARKTNALVTLKSTEGKLSLEIGTKLLLCLADLDQCSVPVLAQLVKERVGYDLLNNKLYPISQCPKHMW